MVNSKSDPVCAQCGSPFPRGQLVRDDFGLDPPTPEHSFCSLGCRDAAIEAWLARPVCAWCGDRFPPTSRPDGTGRPPSYCGPACRKAHERVLDRSLKALARDVFPRADRPSEVEQALADAETLARFWDPGSDVPGPLEPPSPRARNALLGRVDRLQRMRDEAREAAGRAAEAKVLAELAAADRAAVAAAEGADADWRRELLAGIETHRNSRVRPSSTLPRHRTRALVGVNAAQPDEADHER